MSGDWLSLVHQVLVPGLGGLPLHQSMNPPLSWAEAESPGPGFSPDCVVFSECVLDFRFVFWLQLLCHRVCSFDPVLTAG